MTSIPDDIKDREYQKFTDDGSGHPTVRVTFSGASSGDGAILDGVNSALRASVLNLGNGKPLAVAIVDTGGTQIASFGGGTQYTNDTKQATPVGTAALGYTGSTVEALRLRALGTTYAQDVSILDGSGNQITSFGGGTQYADGTASATPTGTVAMGTTGTTVDALQLDSSKNLKVVLNAVGATQYVTFNAAGQPVNATQTGTWTVQPGNTANTTAWKVDGSAVTQPVSVGSTLTVSFNAATQTVSLNNAVIPASQSGTWTVQPGNTANTTAWKVDGSAVTQPVSLGSTVTVTFNAAAQPVTLGAETTKVIGVVRTADGSGNLTTSTSQALDVNVKSATLGATVTTNLDRVGGTFVDANSGNKSAGTLRVVIATDQPALTNKLLVTPDANSAVNVAQMNGVTVTMGNGVSGTGVQRVALASDNTAVAGVGAAATGAAVPANAVYKGLIASTANPTAASAGNLVGAMADKLGKQVVVGSVRDLKTSSFTTITSSVAETTVLSAVASTFLDVYGCIVVNTSATPLAVAFKDSTGGSTQFEVFVPATDTRGFMVPESAGFKQTTVNNNWTATCSASVASVKISMLSVKNI